MHWKMFETWKRENTTYTRFWLFLSNTDGNFSKKSTNWHLVSKEPNNILSSKLFSWNFLSIPSSIQSFNGFSKNSWLSYESFHFCVISYIKSITRISVRHMMLIALIQMCIRLVIHQLIISKWIHGKSGSLLESSSLQKSS